MSRFKDSRGDEWSFRITLATALRVKRDHDVDLLQWQQWSEQLASDQYLLLTVLFACLDQAQVTERKLDLQAFLAFLDGDTFEAAVDAWFEAITDFFPQRLRTPATMLRKTVIQRMEEASGKLLEMETTGELQALVDQVVTQTLGSLSGAPPESSASTPDPAPCAS